MENQYVYGVRIGGAHRDVARTERGAKIYATRNGYDCVTCRNVNTGHAVIVAVRVGRRWVDPDDAASVLADSRYQVYRVGPRCWQAAFCGKILPGSPYGTRQEATEAAWQYERDRWLDSNYPHPAVPCRGL